MPALAHQPTGQPQLAVPGQVDFYINSFLRPLRRHGSAHAWNKVVDNYYAHDRKK